MPSSAAFKASKFCHSCGRIFSWRASMSSDWDSVRYCSKTCRTHRSMHSRLDKLIESTFLSLLITARSDTSLSSEERKISCEKAQEHDGEERMKVEWRERYRRAARRLANVREVCWIERFEKGKWEQGDGKGPMRVELREGKDKEAKELLQELSNSGGRHANDDKVAKEQEEG